MAELTTPAEMTTNSCCAPEAQATCCEPSAKAECCGREEGCGCAAGSDSSQPSPCTSSVVDSPRTLA
jgi:hypothetical protein